MKKMKMPHTLVIIFSFIIIVTLLTWIIPGGKYERIINKAGKELVDGTNFKFVPGKPQGLFALLKAPIKGIIQMADIIGFILLIGGVFAIIQRTKVITVSILRLAKSLRNRRLIIIPVTMTLFSIFGAIFGMSEEVIPFIPIFITMSLAVGYDSIIGTSLPFIGAGLGFAGALFNPFTIGIAQSIAELPTYSGLVYRFIVWIIVTVVGIVFMMCYARLITRNPKASPVYELDRQRQKELEANLPESMEFHWRHILILIWFGLTICAMIFGVLFYNWFIIEIAALFLGMGLIIGFTAGLSFNEMTDCFVEGTKDLIGAALVIGFSKAIVIIATEGQIIDTIMYGLSRMTASFHAIVSAQFMFVINTILNFFIPSGSGKAALTMPILAPLADIIGVTRQTSVLAYQLGDGFTNMIIPTSGVTMAVLGMARIPWEVWAKWLFRFEIFLFILGLLLLIPPVLIKWGPF